MALLVLIAVAGAWVGYALPMLPFPVAVLAFPMGLAWIGFRATTLRKSFKFGWLAGTLAAAGSLYWMVIPISIYGGIPLYLALPAPLLVGAVLGVFYGLFALAAHFAGRSLSGIPLCLLAGLVWAALESVLDWIFTGFPWLSLSAAMAPWPFSVQLASVVGVYGLSGIYAALAVAVLLRKTYRSALWFAVGLAAFIAGFGFVRMQVYSLPAGHFRVAVVQGNVDQGKKWSPDYQLKTADKYARLTLGGMRDNKPELVVWPETAMPFYMQDQSALTRMVTDLADKYDLNIITGTPAYRMDDMRTMSYVLFNRALLINRDGRALQSYDKEHLVPFGEYVPLKWLPLGKLVAGVGDYVPGDDNDPLYLDGVALGMLICYEAIFPELAQIQVEKGANVLVNISNDAWFGDTPAPVQHLHHAVMRAVEQGRWLIRSTNTGISAFIDPLGRIRLRSGQFHEEYLSAEVAPGSRRTVYNRIFHWVSPGICLLAALGLGWAALKRKRA